MSRKSITSKNTIAVGPYSHAVDADGFLFLSGQTPLDPSTNALVEGDIQVQTRQCFENIRAVLEAAGLTMDHVQKVTVFLTDMQDFPAMNAVYQDAFSAPYPARSTVGVASLPIGARVEIECIAKRDH